MTEEFGKVVGNAAIFQSGDLISKPQFNAMSLDIPSGTTFSEWVDLGHAIKQMEQSVMWWVGDWLCFGERKWGERYSQAVEETGYANGTLRNARWVASQYHLSERNDKLTWSHHAVVAAYPHRIQLLARAEAEDWPTRALGAIAKREEREKRLSEQSKGDAPLPDRRYSIIYADPPWQYDFSPSDSRSVENHYPTMSIEEILALPIEGIATEDAMLFLWAPPSFIKKGIETLEAWGFDLASSAVWVKDRIGTGIYFRQQHEYLLLGKRGQPLTPYPGTQASSVIEAPRGRHSEKPVQGHEIIEQMYPELSKIELFSRAPRVGWDAWGNESE